VDMARPTKERRSEVYDQATEFDCKRKVDIDGVLGAY